MICCDICMVSLLKQISYIKKKVGAETLTQNTHTDIKILKKKKKSKKVIVNLHPAPVCLWSSATEALMLHIRNMGRKAKSKSSIFTTSQTRFRARSQGRYCCLCHPVQVAEMSAKCSYEMLTALCCFSNRLKLRALFNYPPFAEQSVAGKQSKTKKP